MGWNSGSRLFSEIISSLKDRLWVEEERKAIYLYLIPIFEDYDCDVLDECLGEDHMFDKALYELHPEYLEEGEENEE